MAMTTLTRNIDLPPSTPAELPYPNLVNSTQYARNNFRPTKREWKRTISPQEGPPALQRNLQKYFGHKDFRHPQLEICTDSLRGCDLIVVAPTGLGKSLCFQLPAITIDHGVTIVVSPLKALMHDQVKTLQEKGIRVAQLNEDSPQEEKDEIKRQMKMGHPEIRLLYLTPEMLLSPRQKIMFDIAHRQRQIARLIIDEAHVITEWGNTFRGTYRELGTFRERYPDIPITALTASATHDVRKDIIQSLRIKRGYGQWVMPFNRRNLFYEVRYQGGGSGDDDQEEVEQPQDKVDDIANFIEGYRPQAERRNRDNGIDRPCVTGVVYCRTTRSCWEVAEHLSQRGISARPFYKSLKKWEKDAAMQGWKEGTIECIVATIAFGMGIDQTNVRYVIHYDMPKTFEGYYQETGRAGRDGHISHCIMYYSREDAAKLRGLVEQEVAKQRKRLSRLAEEDNADDVSPRSSSLDSFKSLQFYAERARKCRHIGICNYFGEKIDDRDPNIKKAYCENMCDVCKNPAAVTMAAYRLTEDVPTASPIPEKEIEVIDPPTKRPASRSSVTSIPNSLIEFHGADGFMFSDGFDEGEAKEPEVVERLVRPDPLSPSPEIAQQSAPTPLLPSHRTPIVPASSSRVSSAPTSTHKTLSAPRTTASLSSAPTSSERPAARSIDPTPRLERHLSAERPIRVLQINPVISSGDPGPSTLAHNKRRREPSPVIMVTPARGVTYLNDSEEGTGSDLKLTKEQRMKAERMLMSVDPVRGSGPFAFYDNVTPLKYRKVSAGTGGFKPPIIKSPNKVRCDLITKQARDASVTSMTEALRGALGHGELARKALKALGRRENGSKRMKVLVNIARAMERDIADTSRNDPAGYARRITEFRKATKALRSEEVVDAIVKGDLDSFDDGSEEVKHLKKLEGCLIGYIPERERV
ncbi:hypothetical protein CI109_100219 [Kwoniella shandongensis]|uniref:ATP-dependent DNA helicase n=1 Tax=Kwoniella shandongensis TaxID=1734106 RepID=A0A5M6BTU2_9TREE|nr:uncharacterized protein CI109_006246 [Kwoniella shandongensis]KAA5525442.1 hypothetical protein CI109_006246 [Kwoniella shandongensis]